MRIRYSAWDGSQDPFEDDVPVADLLEELADDVLSGAGADAAMRRLMRSGIDGRITGLEALRERIRRARAREQERLNLAGPLQDLRRRLDDILDRERSALSFDATDEARERELFLDALPPDVAGRVTELRGYRFTDPAAQRDFDELLDELREQVMGAHFRRIAEGISQATPEAIARFKDMLTDLNAMLDRRARGDPEDFEGFMRRHGDLFPDRPDSLDELLENMARRMAAMQRLLASLSPEQRAELQALGEDLLGDLDLAFEVDRLARHLEDAFPALPWDEPALAGGDEASPLSATVDALERLHEAEDLERAAGQDYPGATLEDVDEDAVQRVLGEDSRRDLRALKRIERELEEAGLLTRREGRLEVTPRGARKLGERALARVFEDLRRDREGTHEARDAGGTAEPTGATRPWMFGDPGRIAVQRTVFNAVVRRGPVRDLGDGGPRLLAQDFEVVEAEQRTEAATALLLDLSFSMPLRGHFVHAKRMALALHALIEGRFPHDRLTMIGFSDYARRIAPEDLTAAGWERVYGTNMHHAFLLAGRELREHPRATRQVIMVTDGEPTAHLEGEDAFFSWPPVSRTIELTLAEAVRLARSGVRINVFMLEESPGLIAFMERLAQLTNGRVFLMQDEALGEFVVRDFLSRRTR